MATEKRGWDKYDEQSLSRSMVAWEAPRQYWGFPTHLCTHSMIGALDVWPVASYLRNASGTQIIDASFGYNMQGMQAHRNKPSTVPQWIRPKALEETQETPISTRIELARPRSRFVSDDQPLIDFCWGPYWSGSFPWGNVRPQNLHWQWQVVIFLGTKEQ